MKIIKRVIVFGIIIFFYLVLVVIMLIKTGIEPSVLQHNLLVFVSMGSLLWLINTTRGNFFKMFSIVAVVYYFAVCFSSVIISLVRNNYSAFDNMGVLARTEGFLAFTLVGFLLLSWRKSELFDEPE